MSTPRLTTLVGPETGGVGHVSRCLAASWPDTAADVHLVQVDESGQVTTSTCGCPAGPAPRLTGWSTALAAGYAAWSHRRCLRASTSLHVELGRTSLGALWFALAAGALARDVPMVVAAHDLPAVAHHPGAALVHRAPGRWDAFAYRVVARLLDRPVLAALRRRARATVVLSAAAAAAARDRSWPGVTQVDHGAAPPARPAVTPAEAGYVLLAGFLGPGKGLDVLAKAWPQVTTSLPLVVAGGSSDQDAPWVAARRAELDAGANPPTWLGYVDDATFDRLVAQSAVVVIPYEQSNPASGVLVRALVEGRAVVATRVAAAVEEVTDEDNGLLVAPGDPVALASALSRLTGSPALRTQLGTRAAQLAAERHSWSRHAGQLVDLHQTLTPVPATENRRFLHV